MYDNPWLYNDEPFYSENINGWYGFVYLITNINTGKKYIGRKYFWSIRKQKGKTRRKRFESDWKDYYGSCIPLLEDVKAQGNQNFKREIVSLHKTKGQVNYNEIKLQFKMDVLEQLNEQGERAFYNDNIASRYFVAKKLAIS